MNYDEWKLWYERILDDFKFSKIDDEDSASLLNQILNDEGFITIEDLKHEVVDFKNTDKFIVFGAGPSIKQHITNIRENYNLDDYILVVADGATTALLEERIVPDIIVTDLDGNMDDILASNYRNSYIVVHAHGNNKHLIAEYTSFLDNVLGTTQSKPEGCLYNFGGFTDGDRAIFLSIDLGAKSIILAGMDFGDIVTKYSRPKNQLDLMDADDIKKRKLKYAEELCNWIKDNVDVELINLCDKSL